MGRRGPPVDESTGDFVTNAKVEIGSSLRLLKDVLQPYWKGCRVPVRRDGLLLSDYFM